MSFIKSVFSTLSVFQLIWFGLGVEFIFGIGGEQNTAAGLVCFALSSLAEYRTKIKNLEDKIDNINFALEVMQSRSIENKIDQANKKLDALDDNLFRNSE